MCTGISVFLVIFFFFSSVERQMPSINIYSYSYINFQCMLIFFFSLGSTICDFFFNGVHFFLLLNWIEWIKWLFNRSFNFYCHNFNFYMVKCMLHGICFSSRLYVNSMFLFILQQNYKKKNLLAFLFAVKVNEWIEMEALLKTEKNIKWCDFTMTINEQVVAKWYLWSAFFSQFLKQNKFSMYLLEIVNKVLLLVFVCLFVC